jgi:hypothetical protein
MRRPKMTVLPATAQPPADNLVDPPARLTHRLHEAQPYYYSTRRTKEAGVFPAGTRVALSSVEGSRCRVIDGNGLSVFTACAGLTPIDPPREKAAKRTAASRGKKPVRR